MTGQRTSGHLADLGAVPDAEPGVAVSLKMGLAPHVNHGEEVCMCASTLASFGAGRQWEESQGQNRTREIRPSGIVGGLTETWGMVSAKRARTAERPKQPSTYLNRRAPCFYPDHILEA